MSICGYVHVTNKPLFVLGGDPVLDKPDDHSATRNITKYLDESLNLTVTPSLKDEPYVGIHKGQPAFRRGEFIAQWSSRDSSSYKKIQVSATMSSEQMIDDLKQYMNVTNEVTISGDEVFIEGDIRSALLQLSPTATIMQPGQSLSLRYHVELWNATEVSVVNRQKPLENTAVTAWIEITDAIIVLEASSPHYSNATVLFDTMRAGVSFAGESFTFTMTFVGVDYDIAYGAGEMRLSDVGNETTTLLYYGGRPQAKTKDGKSTTAVKNILDNLIAVENIDLAAFVSNSWPKMSLTPYNGGPLVGAFAFAVEKGVLKAYVAYTMTCGNQPMLKLVL
nr:C. briggsae CBR-LOV-1 protein [Haemonchus contortus]